MMSNALQLLLTFCRCDFVERNCEKALSVLSKDICWFGTSEHEDVRGIANARAYIRQEIDTMPTPYQMTIHDTFYVPLSDNCGEAFLKMDLESAKVRLSLRATAASRMEDGVQKLCTMHFSVADSSLRPGEYFPLRESREKLARERKELVLSTMAGGLIGGYIQPGFPLYFISERMLEYLDYATEAEFSADIDGLITNMMHPDDRAYVDVEVERQLAVSNQYVVEYRMRKRDGSHIWVRDTGRKSTDEHGEAVIISVCYDITEQHNKQIQLDNLINTLPSGVALYRKENDVYTVLYQSQGVGRLSGRTPQEYKELVEATATEIIYCQDVDRVFAALRKAAGSDETVTLDFRILHASGGTVWISASYRRTGFEDGCPIIHAVFSEMPQVRELLTDIVDNAGVAVVVSDRMTHELLYVNQIALSMYNKTDRDYQGKTCYQYLLGFDKPCEFCRNRCNNVFMDQPKEVYDAPYDRYFMSQGRVINWAGREAHIECLTDITEVKKAQQQLAEMLQNVTCGIVVCDGNSVDAAHTIQYMNESFCRLFESTEAQLRQRYAVDIYMDVHPDDREKAADIRRQLLETQSHAEGALRFILPAGRMKWLYLAIKAVRRPDGTAATYSTYHDVTTQFEQEQQLRDLLHTVPGGICLFRWDGNSLTPVVVSEQFAAMLDVDLTEPLEKMEDLHFSLIAPEDIPDCRRAFAYAVEHPGRHTHTYRMRNTRTDGWRWIYLQGVTIAQSDGSVFCYIMYTDITEERLMAQKLATSEQALETATEAAGLWYWKYDPAHDRAYYHKKAIQDFFLPAMAENYPQSLLDSGIILPQHHDIFRNAVAQIKNGAPQVVFEAQGTFRDGSVHWCEFRFTNLPQVGGQTPLAVCTASLIDLEKSLLAKYEVERQKPRLGEKDLLFHAIFNLETGKTEEYGDAVSGQSLLAQLPDMQRGIDHVVGSIVGAEAREDMYRINSREYLREQLQQDNLSFSMDYRRKLPDGRIRWVRNILHLVIQPDTRDLLLFEYCYDIHAQAMSKEVLRLASLHDYERIASVNLARGTMIPYGEGDNAAAETVFDYDAARRNYARVTIADNEKNQFLADSSPETVMRQVAKNRQHVFTNNIKTANGTEGIIKTRFIPYDEENHIYIMTRTDVTDILRAEEAKNAKMKEALSIAQQANSAKSAFLSAMSHDMRTPMNAIINMCELAIADEGNAAQVHKSLAVIQSSSQLLLSLINNILDMSRIESGTMTLNNQSFSIAQEVNRTAESFHVLAEQKEQTFTVHLDLRHDNCCGDAARIHSALDNILSNAIKYTPKGGTITYRVSEIPSTKPGIGLYRFEISDTGLGMDQEALQHLFEPFYRAKDSLASKVEGTGLGLSISKAIIDLKGGTISVKSTKGEGTTFVVELPIPLEYGHDTAPQQEGEADSLAAYDLSHLHVLLCEDHPVNQEIATIILEKAGAKVTMAEDGQVGVDTFLHTPAGSFDIILMDVRMPKMDGYEATRAIRASNHPQAKTIPIIAMTANAFAEDVQKSIAAGMNNHLAKPIVPLLLYKTILHYSSSFVNALE